MSRKNGENETKLISLPVDNHAAGHNKLHHMFPNQHTQNAGSHIRFGGNDYNNGESKKLIN
jgi:hypothetical protein